MKSRRNIAGRRGIRRKCSRTKKKRGTRKRGGTWTGTFSRESYIDSVNTFTPRPLPNLPEDAKRRIFEFIKLYESEDPDHIQRTVYDTGSLLVLLNVLDETMVKDYANKKVSIDALYFNILNQLLNSMNKLPIDIQDELHDLLGRHCLTRYTNRIPTRVIRIPLINSDKNILIKCETQAKITKEWTIIQQIKEKCGIFMIPYYELLDCEKNLCILCPNKSNSAIVMQEYGTTLEKWIQRQYRYDDPIYYGTLTKIFLKIIDALYCLHSNDFYHGDVKPNNIMVSGNFGEEEVKLIDFEKSGVLKNGVLDDSTTKAGTDEYKLHKVSKVSMIDLEGVAIMLYVFVFLQCKDVCMFLEYVKKVYPSIPKTRCIFPKIIALDPLLEDMRSPGGSLGINAIRILEHYIHVLMGRKDKWFTSHDLAAGLRDARPSYPA